MRHTQSPPDTNAYLTPFGHPRRQSSLQRCAVVEGGRRPGEEDERVGHIAVLAAAAQRAKEAGFDAVQLHAAHGYLINQFLSPLTNRRNDRYGGSVENRSRFLLDVFRAVRGAVGSDFPLLVKLNGADNLEGGLDADDALYAAKALDEAGATEVSVCCTHPVLSGPAIERLEGSNIKEVFQGRLNHNQRESSPCKTGGTVELRQVER